ncbi:hypothetical protein PILCRDRAFT_48563, partial [Piloderma croceum F 1598]
STGSSIPSSSLSALWCYILPALDRILQSNSDAKHAPVLPITAEYYIGIYTHCYDYFIAQSNSTIGLSGLYKNLDHYYADAAHQLFTGAPNDNTLIPYILAKFKYYSAGTAAIDRLLSYLNHHYVKPAVNDGNGWFSFDDDAVVTGDKGHNSGSKVSWGEGEDRRVAELKKWGYKGGSSASVLAKAEACAEAASTLDCVVPLSSLALRRFRTNFIEPLMQVSNINHKIKHDSSVTTEAGQLVRVVKEMLEMKGVGEDENRQLAKLAVILKTVGVRHNKLLRKK